MANISQGIDIVKIERLEEMIKNHGQKVLDRVFSKKEQEYCEPKKRKFEHYAARFAAKEALIKALKNDTPFPLDMCDIEISKHASGRPEIILTPVMIEHFPYLKKAEICVSLSHEREFAIASVIISFNE